jgi:alkanesulfonate monooxygenase SsuD/methylene tetrahydromethanopterin reductase-like flavin-dependent oxidoreductase (luciferase family)
MLDEGLELLTHLWQGEPFEYVGQHYHAHRPEMMIPPPSVQRPRITTWVVGLWPAPKSMRRVARYDGWLPNYRGADGARGEPSPAALAKGVAWLRDERARSGLDMDDFDVVVEGSTEPGHAGVDEVLGWADAGATWWLEANWAAGDDVVQTSLDRLRAGPPRI